ncbi:T9SS type A sorting domain-containing protein [Aquirufa regiilacus]
MINRFLKGTLFCLFVSYNSLAQIGYKEKFATLQRNFNSTNIGGPTWDEFGDLVFEKNNKTYWLSTFCSIVDVAVDYYRLFEVDYSSGSIKEVTKEMLGDFYPTGGYNPPYYYEDVDNDGIKDILIFNHGKEIESERGTWGDLNIFFKGGSDGFKKTEIPGVTLVKKYYHAHALEDFDLDGDKDIAYGSDVTQIFINDGKGNFTEQRISNLATGGFYQIGANKYNAGSFGLKFTNLDQDKELELLSTVTEQPIYLDYSPGGWTAKLFANKDSFVWKPNIHIGVEQTLEIPNAKSIKNDLFYRVTTFDYPQEGGSQMKWMTKMFMSKSAKIDSIYLIKNDLSATNSFFYLDPKLVDLNFDGTPDIFFKEDEFWGNTGQKLHPINQRMWMNDGNNNFNSSSLKFADNANQYVYILAKVDSVKKINILFSQRSTPFDKAGKFTQDIRYMYNRIDTIVYPIQKKQAIKLCVGSTQQVKVSKVPVGIVLTDSGTNSNTISMGQDYVQIKANVAGEGLVNYKLKNDFFESDINSISYTILDKPAAPLISREGANLLSSYSTGNQWYLDGIKIPGESGSSIKATSSGIYSVQLTDKNGCMSNLSKGEYGLITATQLEDGTMSFPNPFDSVITIRFSPEIGVLSKVELVDLNGKSRYQQENVANNTSIDLSSLADGIYILTISPNGSNTTLRSKFIKQRK